MQHIILDTNIWLSYIITKKLPDLVDLIYSNDLVLYGCQPLYDELEEVLGRKKFRKYLDRPIEEYVSFQKRLTKKVDTEKIFTGSPDSKDDFLFDLANQSEATHLVTGDKNILEFSYPPLKIISFAEFRNSF